MEAHPLIYNNLHEKIDTLVEGNSDATTTIVFVHGFGANKNEGSNYFVDVANALKDKYRIVRFDFSGYGDSEGKQEEVDYEKQTKDLQAVLDYVRKELGGKTYIYAHSMGCFVTALLSPDDIEKTIFTSIPNTNTKHLSNFFVNWISSKDGAKVDKNGISLFPRSAGGVQKIGASFWSVMEALDPISLVSSYSSRTKLLIIHAKEDPIIGLQYVEEYATIAGVEDVWIHGDHNYTKKEDRDVLIEKVQEFLSK